MDPKAQSNPPAEKPTPPATAKAPVTSTGNTPPAAGKPGGKDEAVKVIDASKEQGLGWKSHQGSSGTAAQQNKGKRWYTNPIIIGPIALTAVLLLAVGALLLLKKPAVNNAVKQVTGIDLQNVGDQQLKKLSEAAKAGTTRETLTVTANGVFQHDLTVDGTTNLQGGLNSKQIITGQSGLNVSGASALDDVTIRGNLGVNGRTNLQGDVDANGLLTVHGKLSVGGDGGVDGSLTVSHNLTVNGTLTAGSLTVRDLSVPGTITVGGHIISGGDNPAVSLGPGIGSGGSAHVSGNDTAGTLIIDTGSGPSASNLATVTFRKTFGTVPKVILTPVGTFSAKLQYYTARTPGNFTFFTNTAPVGATEYAYDYIVIE